MEQRVPRRGISLAALIAEAKRRARQRRLLIGLVVAAVAAVATVALHPWGNGSRTAGAAGPATGAGAGSRVVHFGIFALTVPKGFLDSEAHPSPDSSTVTGLVVENYPASSKLIAPANWVAINVEAFNTPLFFKSQTRTLPLTFDKLPLSPGQQDPTGTRRMAFIRRQNQTFQVMVFEGNKAPAADRTAIERALSSIRTAR